MFWFETRTTVARLPSAVFAHILDTSKWPSFCGHGPLPGIASAEVEGGGPIVAGSRVRVTNTDGSVHHEIVEELERDRRYRVRMELARPAALVLRRIDETVELSPAGAGTDLRRRFEVTPRSWLTAPLAWFVCRVLLRRAVLAHNAAVARELEAVAGDSTSAALARVD